MKIDDGARLLNINEAFVASHSLTAVALLCNALWSEGMSCTFGSLVTNVATCPPKHCSTSVRRKERCYKIPKPGS